VEVSLYDNGDMETVVLLGDAGTEVMDRQAQDLMDYYLEVSSLLLTQLSDIYTHVQFTLYPRPIETYPLNIRYDRNLIYIIQFLL